MNLRQAKKIAKKIAKRQDAYTRSQRRAARHRLWRYVVTHRLFRGRPWWTNVLVLPDAFRFKLTFGAPLRTVDVQAAAATVLRVTLFNQACIAVPVA